jgi:hypothetical protein
MQVQIKFTASGSSSQFGNFAPGDLLRCTEEQAAHFVNEANCAVYVDAMQTPAQRVPAAVTKPARKTKAAE